MKSVKGFVVIEIVLALVVLAIIGFVGYTAYNNRIDKDTYTEPSVANDIPAGEDISTVETAKDLNEMNSLLNSVDLNDDHDIKQLNKELSDF